MTETLSDYFPSYCEIEETTGINPATLIKFRGFYLKIYSRPNIQSYEVQKYLYGISELVATDIVPYQQMREFALSRYSAKSDRIHCIRRGR